MRRCLLVSLMITLAGAAFLVLTACANTNGTADKSGQALVCPECKMVIVTVQRQYYPRGPRFAGYPESVTIHQDKCPACGGATEFLFKDGKLKHRCSICNDSPFTCPIFHPTNN